MASAARAKGLRRTSLSETIKRIPTNALEVIVLAMLLLLAFFTLDKKRYDALQTLMLFTLVV